MSNLFEHSDNNLINLEFESQIFKSSSSLQNEITYLYKTWKKNCFTLDFIKDLIYKQQIYLLKKYLYLHHIKNISLNKINNVIEFLNSKLNQKKLRIANKKFLVKQTKILSNKNKIHVLYII